MENFTFNDITSDDLTDKMEAYINGIEMKANLLAKSVQDWTHDEKAMKEIDECFLEFLLRFNECKNITDFKLLKIQLKTIFDNLIK